MNKFFAVSLLAVSVSAFADTPLHWAYEGQAGPDSWGDLSAEFATCKIGKFQSPIDIRNAVKANLPPLQLDFHTAAESLINNGHTLQVTVEDEDDFRLDNRTFTLRQYHFHAPSENLIDGKRYPLEAHFVHADAQGQMAVIAVMFEVGQENTALQPLIESMPKEKDHAVAIDKRFDLSPLFPADRHYYRFSGSLTTPPCTEGLRWLVMKEPVTLSAAQLAKFQQALEHSNNRPIQPLNGRVIVE
ncbi:carbonic anhydrase [Serratia ureilytica]|uniref:carbonic anhydrase n=1 Tax=Serratia ureilytica TaxID=300181 RepID=UPI00214E09C3|nr:carbonic anhydrase family protein [Serratia ureilytica]UUW17345.1 carbonic anhydrase family protein [Serratia ureilytica]